jgi:hypothetical protein
VDPSALHAGSAGAPPAGGDEACQGLITSQRVPVPAASPFLASVLHRLGALTWHTRPFAVLRAALQRRARSRHWPHREIDHGTGRIARSDSYVAGNCHTLPADWMIALLGHGPRRRARSLRSATPLDRCGLHGNHHDKLSADLGSPPRLRA